MTLIFSQIFFENAVDGPLLLRMDNNGMSCSFSANFILTPFPITVQDLWRQILSFIRHYFWKTMWQKNHPPYRKENSSRGIFYNRNFSITKRQKGRKASHEEKLKLSTPVFETVLITIKFQLRTKRHVTKEKLQFFVFDET